MKAKSQGYDYPQPRGQQYTQQPTITSPPQNSISKPISSHYKQFLLERASSFRKTQQSSPESKAIRIAFTHSVKKNSLCRKILNTSINKYTLQQDLTRYQQKFEGGKSQTRDMHSFVFREIWDNQQKKKFEQDLSRKGKSQFTTIEVNHQRGKSQEVKTFQHFIQHNKKSHDRKRSQQQNEQGTPRPQGLEGKQSINLAISGNHHELKKKPQTAKNVERQHAGKVRFVKNNKAAGVISLGDCNPENAQVVTVALKSKEIEISPSNRQQLQKKQPTETTKDLVIDQKEGSKIKKNKNDTISFQARQARSKIQIKYQNCYKNFFSPCNGIQIKYLSSENQDSFVTINKFPIKRSIEPFRSIRPTFRPIFKKNQAPPIDTRSIVFRSKSTTKEYEPPCIEPWKVNQEQTQQFNDFYQQQ